MKVGKIISMAAFLGGNVKLSKKIDGVINGDETFTKEEKEEVEKYMKYYDITVSELSQEYYPLTYKEDLKSQDGKYYYKDLKKTILEIKSVYRSDIALKYRVYPEYFTCGDLSCTVEYVYLIKEAKSLDDDCVFDATPITGRVIAEGVVAEALMNDGMFEEAITWRDRYEKSLKTCLLRKRVKRLKARGWY